LTTFQGKNGNCLNIKVAYISVLKGTNAGVNTVHSQQQYLLEKETLWNNAVPYTTKCPRKEAIKALRIMIGDLQAKDHAIVLALDANQTPLE
jgi:hypothetical protein